MRSAASVIASDLSTTTTATTTITTTAAVATATTTTTRAIIKPALRNIHDRGASIGDLGGLSHLHHYVRVDNVPELQAVHQEAYPTAIFYVTTILALYACGLLIILIHYMNSSYGKWAWSFNDVWDELRPAFLERASKSKESQNPECPAADTSTHQESKRLTQKVICDDEEECDIQKNQKSKKKNSSRNIDQKSLAQKLQSRLKVSKDNTNEDEEHPMSTSLEATASMASNSLRMTNHSVVSSLLGGQQCDEKNNSKENEVVTVDINYHPNGVERHVASN